MQSSSEQPLVGEERYVTTLTTAAKETRSVYAKKTKNQMKKKIVSYTQIRPEKLGKIAR